MGKFVHAWEEMGPWGKLLSPESKERNGHGLNLSDRYFKRVRKKGRGRGKTAGHRICPGGGPRKTRQKRIASVLLKQGRASGILLSVVG